MPNALIAPGGVVDRRRRTLTPQDYELIQAYRGRPVSLDVLGPPPSTMETVGALAPLAGAALFAPSLPLALATIPAYHAITSGALSRLPSIPTLPGEPWATLSDFVLGMGGGGPGAYNRAAVIRRPTPGFKSTLKGLVEQKLPSKATPEQLEAIARYAPKEEVQYVNLSDFAGGPLRKEDVLGHIEQRNVPLEETLRTEADVRYGSYRTPGGEDYRELLLTLPDQAKARMGEINREIDLILERVGRDRPSADQQQRLDRLNNEYQELALGNKGVYKSGHWQEPNVLAHTRLNTFLDPQGKKVLLVDEIQSDWHQAGRERGYVGSAPDLATLKQKRDDVRAQIEAMRPDADAGRIPQADFLRVIDEFQQADHAYRQAASGTDPNRVPDAPFKREWHELAFKRALREAAETGAEKMAWTTGTQQAQRYDLAKHISKLEYLPEVERLRAYDPQGRRVLTEDVPPHKIDEYVGKETADKLRKRIDEYDPGLLPDNPPSLEGLDLQVGGEGMKGFYDQILPSFANKYLKQFGVKTGETELPFRRSDRTLDTILREDFGTDWGSATEAQQQRAIAIQEGRDTPPGLKVHSIDITPELRQFLMRGQPLFGSKK